ncbi:hypothetical protein [Streptomyces atroolivaceus]|uniref:hypothetical protein n=1 Tax=Streptomyces atroolivaceus TaxID=66869 RepID=UPI00343F139D
MARARLLRGWRTESVLTGVRLHEQAVRHALEAVLPTGRKPARGRGGGMGLCPLPRTRCSRGSRVSGRASPVGGGATITSVRQQPR